MSKPENVAYFTYAFGDLAKDPLDQCIDMWACKQDAYKHAERWRNAGMTVIVYYGERYIE